MSFQVINADKHPNKDRKGMVSIPGRDPGLDISYSPPGRHPSFGSSSSGTPTSPNSWEETLQLLSRELQVICKSPDRYDIPSFPMSPRASPGPTSPIGSELQSRGDAKALTVRHLQSEEKLREKLTYICRSPRRSLQQSISTEGYPTTQSAKIVRASKRKPTYGLPYFRTTVEIGNRGIEDIRVYVENRKLKVLPKSNKVSCNDSPCDLPAIIEIPPEVNPAKLLCIVKDGILEVKESKRRGGHTKGRFVNGLDLHRSLSAGGQRWLLNAEQNPIIIEDEGSHQLKLVLQVPKDFNFEDLKIKTVDDHLIVSGKRCQSLTESCDLAASQTLAKFFSEKDELFQVFELPSSVDPYSITAHLTENMQLIIQAKLSPRSRSNSW